MSNLETIAENFCSVDSLKNYILCAYPNFLVLGKPLKTLSGIKFEKNTYFRIRVLDFETWFNHLNLALQWFLSDEMNVLNETILEEQGLQYYTNCAVIDDKKQLKIGYKQNSHDLIFNFDVDELKALMLSFSDLMMHAFCLEENVLRLFYLLLNHHFCLPIEKGSKKIANLNFDNVFSRSKVICGNHQIEGSVFLLTEYVLKHKMNLLIMYHFKKSCVMPAPSLILKYLE